MNDSLSNVRWLRILIAAVAVIVMSILVLMAITTGYAIVLAFQARGVPAQSDINHFAARVSPRLMPWLEMMLTFIITLIVARRAGKAGTIHGLFIGVLAGLLSMSVTLVFAGRLGLRSAIYFLIIVALGWLGGFVGQQWTGSESGQLPPK